MVSAPYSGLPSFASLGAYAAVWQPAQNIYAVTPTPPADSFKPGQGAWLFVNNPVTIASTGQPVDPTVPFTIQIQAGWNQVSNPFVVPLPLSSFSVQSSGSTVSLPFAITSLKTSPLYAYDSTNGQYNSLSSATQTLDPWLGAWLYTAVPASLVIAPPGNGAAPSPFVSSASVTSSSPPTTSQQAQQSGPLPMGSAPHPTSNNASAPLGSDRSATVTITTPQPVTIISVSVRGSGSFVNLLLSSVSGQASGGATYTLQVVLNTLPVLPAPLDVTTSAGGQISQVLTLSLIPTGYVASGIVRTLAYHQITSLSASPVIYYGASPRLSGDGSKLVFAMYPDAANPNGRILVMNSDGTGQIQVDAFQPSDVDISDSGSKVLITDATQLRVASGDGSASRALVKLASNEINAIKISPDGARAYFRIYRNTTLTLGVTAGPTPIERGIWTINTDGTGLRQVVGVSSIAAAQGIAATAAPFFGSDTNQALDVSTDGSRIVFACTINSASATIGEGVFAVNSDGAGLQNISGRSDFIFHLSISADGSRIGYDRAIGNTTELDVINFDGSGKLKLADNSILGQPVNVVPGVSDRIRISDSGAVLFTGGNSLLYNTDGSGVLQMSVGPAAAFSKLVAGGLGSGTMNAAGNRVLYTFIDKNNIQQLSTVDINPSSLGSALTISSPNFNPPYVLTNQGSSSTLTVKVTGAGTILGVHSTALRNGLVDADMRFYAGSDLFDDGSHGDAIAGDMIFTNNNFFAEANGQVGPRTIRISAEATGTDGKLHATAVDVEPFTILMTLPTR